MTSFLTTFAQRKNILVGVSLEPWERQPTKVHWQQARNGSVSAIIDNNWRIYFNSRFHGFAVHRFVCEGLVAVKVEVAVRLLR